jgi:hypothetical protein
LAYDVPGTDAGNEWKVKKVRVSSILLPWNLSEQIMLGYGKVAMNHMT